MQLLRSAIVASWTCLIALSSCTPVFAAAVGDCIAIEFTSSGSEACRRMSDATDRALRDGWVIRRIDLRSDPVMVERWKIQTTPTTILVRNGREVDRIMGPVDFSELTRRMIAASSENSFREIVGGRPSRESGVDTPRPAIVRGQSQPAVVPMPSAMQRLSNNSPSVDTNLVAQNATVRIRVEDATHESVGTGTIIDTHDGEALVITCGHLFRDSNAQTKVTIEMFANGQPVPHQATVIDFQANETDIGLVAFRPSLPVSTARLLPQSQRLGESQRVYSWGCDHGQPPSRRDSSITKLNRYLGEANVEVGGAPVQGRSGGGLFNELGDLIGVCYAADNELNEGLYSGPEVVYKQLSRLGLVHLYNRSAEAEQSIAATGFPAPTSTASLTNSNQNAANTSMANTTFAANNTMNDAANSRGIGRSINSPATAASNAASSTEQLTVVVRDRSGAQQQLQIANPSPQLLQALAAESQRVAR